MLRTELRRRWLGDHHARRRDAEMMVGLRAVVGNQQAMLRREADRLEHGLYQCGIALESELVRFLQKVILIEKLARSG
jgi:hypothetical protein